MSNPCNCNLLDILEYDSANDELIIKKPVRIQKNVVGDLNVYDGTFIVGSAGYANFQVKVDPQASYNTLVKMGGGSDTLHLQGNLTVDDKLTVGDGGAVVGTGGILTTGNMAVQDTLFLTKSKTFNADDRGKCSHAVIRFDKTWSNTQNDDVPFIADNKHFNVAENLLNLKFDCAPE